MYEQLTLEICQNVNVTVSAFHVKVSQLLEGGVDSKTLEALSFLRSCGWLKPDTLKFYSQKMSRDCSTTMGGQPLEPSSEQWMNWGTMSNGNYLTADIGFRKTGNGCSLSDILEENPHPKYFLSSKAVKRLLSYKDTEVVETLKRSGGAIGGTQAHAAVMNDTSPALATFNGAQTLYAEPIAPSLNAGDRRTRGIFPTDRGGR